jgi:small subunit ribosomal protein S19
MTRSNWKIPATNKQIFKKLETLKKTDKKIEAKRNTLILPKFYGKDFLIHNGKKLNLINVNEDMIGLKFGEFVFTRKQFVFKKKMQK